MNTPENTRYREAAEYNTTVEAAQKTAGLVTPTDCLAYELEQYVAVCSKHFHYSDNNQSGRPERLSANHPDYPRRLAECRESAEQQLARAYELRAQELADEGATARERIPPDERLLLAWQLKESAHLLLDGYADYLVRVGIGRVIVTGSLSPIMNVRETAYPKDAAARLRIVKERTDRVMYGFAYDAGPYKGLDRGLIVGAAGAAELAHFQAMLEAFHEREQGESVAVPKHRLKFLDTRTLLERVSEIISKQVTEKEAEANTNGYTILSEPKTPTVPAPFNNTANGPVGVRTAKRSPDRLSFDELALLCVYAGHCITDANAKEYLEGELKSGRALYNRFTHYSSQSNRTGLADETARKRKNMIARIQKVLPRLNDEQKKRAENEIHILTAQNQ